MTTAILSPPKHYRKDTADDPPVVEFLLALIALVVVFFVEHDAGVKRGAVIAVSAFTFGFVMALHLAGVR